jgi:hypothetical protein
MEARGQLQALVHLSIGKNAQDRRLTGPRDGLDVVVKRKMTCPAYIQTIISHLFVMSTANLGTHYQP